MRRPSNITIVLVVSLLALFFSYGAMATNDQRAFRQQEVKRDQKAKQIHGVKQVHDRIRMVRMWKLTDYLKLDEETAAKLFPVLNRYDDKRLAVNEERVEILKEIKAELDKETPDEKKLEELLNKMEELRLQMEKLNQDERIECKKILSIEQQAKMLLFYRSFDRDLYRMVRDKNKIHRN